MQNNYGQSKLSYYLNYIIRQIQNALITSPEIAFVAAILVGIILLFIVAKLFIL